MLASNALSVLPLELASRYQCKNLSVQEQEPISVSYIYEYAYIERNVRATRILYLSPWWVYIHLRIYLCQAPDVVSLYTYKVRQAHCCLTRLRLTTPKDFPEILVIGRDTYSTVQFQRQPLNSWNRYVEDTLLKISSMYCTVLYYLLYVTTRCTSQAVSTVSI